MRRSRSPFCYLEFSFGRESQEASNRTHVELANDLGKSVLRYVDICALFSSHAVHAELSHVSTKLSDSLCDSGPWNKISHVVALRGLRKLSGDGPKVVER